MLKRKHQLTVLIFGMFLFAGAILLIVGCAKQEECGDVAILELNLIKQADITNGERPEIISTQDKVFVIYSVPSEGVGDEEIRVQIFDSEFNYITSKAIVTSSIEHGNPNDFRIFSDGQHAYIFYMVSSGTSGSYLFGAKYALDDNFERVAYTGVITNAKRHGFGCTGTECAQEGDERIDDPAPMVAGDYVFVMTGIVSTQSQEGNTIYRLRKYDKSLNKLGEFDIDLSDVTDGETGQSSILYEAGYYFIVRATFVEVCENPLQWGCPADIAMIKLDNNWDVADSKVIADDSYGTDDHNEQYVTGFQTDDNYFYIAYNRAGGGMSSILKVYDKNWNEVLEKELRVSTGGAVRPSIFVSGNSLYSGNHDEQSHIAEVSVYEIKRD